MDTLDMAIWCLLGNKYYEPPYASYRRPDPWKVAKEVGVDGRTVKTRIQRMERDGFIKYYQIIPNYNLFRMKATSFIYSVGDIVTKYAAIKKVESLVEGTLEIWNLIGDSFMIWLAHEDDQQKEQRLRILEEVTGCKTPLVLYDRMFPQVTISLSNLDWQIIKSLRNNALKPISQIEKEVGVTRKTVKKRLERLVQNKVFVVRAVFDASKASGIQICIFCIFLDDAVGYEDKEYTKQRVLKELDDLFKENAFVKIIPPASNTVLFGIFSTRVGEPEDFFIRVRNVKGVKDTVMKIVKDVTEFPYVIDERIERNMTANR